MRFIGDYPGKADAKGRVFLPSAFRKIVEAESEQGFVLRNDIYEHCLVLYPKSVWEETYNNLKKGLNEFNRQHRMVIRQFALDSEEIVLDSNGRLLLSKRRLEYAGIKSDVRFVAVDDKIEIWAKEALDDFLNATPALSESMENLFGNV